MEIIKTTSKGTESKIRGPTAKKLILREGLLNIRSYFPGISEEQFLFARYLAGRLDSRADVNPSELALIVSTSTFKLRTGTGLDVQTERYGLIINKDRDYYLGLGSQIPVWIRQFSDHEFSEAVLEKFKESPRYKPYLI
jgi:hypothetical protein